MRYVRVLTAGLLTVGFIGTAAADPLTYTFQTIDYPGATETPGNIDEAVGINNSGTIVGNWGSPGNDQPYTYSNGVFTSLPSSGYSSTTARSITDNGTVVGSVEATPSSPVSAFLFSGGSYSIYNAPGQSNTGGAALTTGNVLYGTYSNGGVYTGFSWQLPSGSFSSLNYPGASDTVVNGANSAGWFVGSEAGNNPSPSGPTAGCGSSQCFAFYFDGSAYNLISIVGATDSEATAVNDDDLVVGTFSNGAIDQGFTWDNGKLTIVDVPGAVDTDITGINDAGQIVGDYIDADGAQHGFLGDPVPEPSSIALFISSLIGLAAYSRRNRTTTTRRCGTA